MAYNKPPKITGFMPESCHSDDRQWIFSKLSTLDQDERLKVCSAYTKALDLASRNEPLSHRKTGKARFAANNRLRIYIAKKFAVFNR